MNSVTTMTATHPEDAEVAMIAAARRGDRAALAGLVRRHDRWLRAVLYGTLDDPAWVDDAAQQVWAQVCKQIGTLKDARAWRGWLYRLARNAATDIGRKVSRDRGRVILPDDASLAGDEGPLRSVLSSEVSQRVMSAIRGLPAIYREPFILRHVEDWSYAQIGETLSLPVDTVETRLVRARRLLREALAPMLKDE
jgi:RNA polymerase sigma-70 factor (ECF subfamily)